MPRYTLVEDTLQSRDRYELQLAEDGTFAWSYGRSDAMGDMGSGTASGTWTRAGEVLTLAVAEHTGDPPPGSATLRGDRLEVDGVGALTRS